MALPHLVKYIYNNGSDEVVRRGKKIHSLGYVEMIEHDELTGNIFFRIKDDNYSTFYKVNIQKTLRLLPISYFTSKLKKHPLQNQLLQKNQQVSLQNLQQTQSYSLTLW